MTISNERSAKALMGILRTFIFKGGNMIINVILVPLTISFISPSEYGVWLTLSSIIAWFSVSDIGFGNGLRNRFAEAVAIGNKELARSYVSTAYFSVSILMLIVWVVFCIINYFLDWNIILNTNAEGSHMLSKVVLVVFSSFCLQFVLKLVGTVMIAYQEPGKIALFDFLSNLLVLLSIYLMIKLDLNGTLMYLAIISGLAQLSMYFIATLWFYRHDLREYRPSLKFFKAKYIRQLMGIGMKFFIVQISAIFVFQCTNIIIAQLLGSDQVSIYNIAYKYYTIPLTIALIVVSPIWSAFTDAYTKRDYSWMRVVFKTLVYFSVFISLLLFLFLLLSEIIYKHWIGNAVTIPTGVSIMMMLNILATSIFNIFIFVVNGIGKLFLQLWLNVILSLIYIPVAILLGYQFGLNGIIGANLIVNTIYAIVVPIQCYKLLYNKMNRTVWSR
ncbi:lipopolysaccharide biosynthesis protein [Sphingobacterium siyangense]|uniref:lipopolysaccharide biosynthesis protein n=1 Tax=Sphingobacterium siyangense TaxID=459529 RepID=UPI003DA5C68B